MYVEELIGPDTVNTMPLETLEAFADHGEVRGDTVLEGVEEAEQLLEDLAAAGVDYDDVVAKLEAEGVQKFADAFDELIEGIEARRGELAAHVTTERRELVARIWSRDPTVWTGKDEARWLGWLDEPRGCATTSTLLRLGEDVLADAEAVVLLGMGGSSLAPEVIRALVRRRARCTSSTRRTPARSGG